MTYQFPDSVLIIFCKAPVAGQVKTRLQPELTAEQAADVHRELTLMTLNRAFEQPLCAVQLCCAPDTGHPFFQQCAANYALSLTTQRGDDLGARMFNAINDALADYSQAILIGCDCPSLTVKDLQQALTVLQNAHEIVIAPTEDGGYVLIGMNAPQPALFENMSWGNGEVMTATRERANAKHLMLFELPMQWDVDTAKDLHRFLVVSPDEAQG